MKLTFIGSGSAFTVGADNYQSNILIENESQQRLLIDCGSDVRFSLFELGLTSSDINAVFVSHLHTDHTGGLEWLAFSTFFAHSKKPTLFVTDTLVKDLWDKVLSGGLSSVEGIRATLSTFFNVKKIKGQSFIWSGIKFTLIATEHTKSGKQANPSYGLLFTINGVTIVITGDSKFTPAVFEDFYHKADIIFNDCEISPKPSGVHATYGQLKQLDAKIKRKMWLYHYQPEKLPNAKKDGFLGFVRKSQSFKF